MINGPKLWSKLLETAPQGAILMGGAITDLLSSVQPKDYDLYYYTPMLELARKHEADGWYYQEPADAAAVAQMIEDYNVGAALEGQPHRNPILAVHNYKVVLDDDEPIDVQLMRIDMPDPRKMQKKFDHTLCLGRYGPQGLYIDNRVFDSLKNKTVTCTNVAKRVKSLERAMKKVERIDPQGYRDWNFLGF